MAVNPYLAIAMTIGASIEGIRDAIDPGLPIDKPLYDVTDAEMSELGIRRLPRTLLEAIERFDDDPLAAEVFGDTMHGMYSQYKHDEWNRFHEHITEWEQVEYLRFF
jgi:glutamine synthetase